MTKEQQAALVFSQSAAALIEMQSMIAANAYRAIVGASPAYGEGAFYELIEKYRIGFNDVAGMFRS